MSGTYIIVGYLVVKCPLVWPSLSCSWLPTSWDCVWVQDWQAVWEQCIVYLWVHFRKETLCVHKMRLREMGERLNLFCSALLLICVHMRYIFLRHTLHRKAEGAFITGCATPPHVHPMSRYITAQDTFYQAFPCINTASQRREYEANQALPPCIFSSLLRHCYRYVILYTCSYISTSCIADTMYSCV